MPVYHARVNLRCSYFGGVEVEADNEEEAKEKMNDMINDCFGTAHGKLRTYFYCEGITVKNVFNLLRSEYDLEKFSKGPAFVVPK